MVTGYGHELDLLTVVLLFLDLLSTDCFHKFCVKLVETFFFLCLSIAMYSFLTH